jgi:FkbM family methyltransferase
MNFSAISNKSIIGRILRFPLKLIPKNIVMPILQGSLKGKKWITGSANNGHWLGSYEYEEQKLISGTVLKGKVFFDIGAHVGYYSLLTSVLVGDEGKVFSFEPFPNNLEYIQKHLKLNNISNVNVLGVAVSDKHGSIFFSEGPSSSMGKITDNKTDLEVKMIKLDDEINNKRLPIPDYIKIDIEGAEALALRGAESTLSKYHPFIFLSTHGEKVKKECCDFLLSLGYQLNSMDENSLDKTTEVFASFQS